MSLIRALAELRSLTAAGLVLRPAAQLTEVLELGESLAALIGTPIRTSCVSSPRCWETVVPPHMMPHGSAERVDQIARRDDAGRINLVRAV